MLFDAHIRAYYAFMSEAFVEYLESCAMFGNPVGS